MLLTALILIPLIGGALAAFAGEGRAPRWISVIALTADLAICLYFSFAGLETSAIQGQGAWLAFVSADWIPRFGITYELGLDGLSLLMILLTP